MNIPFQVICIDDRNRPNEIPQSLWIKKDQEYTVIGAVKCNTQGGALAFMLEELDISGYPPFIGFSANRFRIKENKPEEVLEEVLEESI